MIDPEDPSPFKKISETHKPEIDKKIFRENSSGANRKDLTTLALKQRKQLKGLHQSEFTIMREPLQKKYVREVEGVQQNLPSICKWILANQDKTPATTDNIKLVYPDMG